MGQVAFLIVFLFAFGKRKRVSTFRASDLDVWHIADSPMRGTEVSHSLCSSGRKRIIIPFPLAVSERIRKSDNAQILPTVLASETVK